MKIKIDPDHRALEDQGPLGEREYEDGGWANFERWAGVSWFGGHAEYKERYGTIRNDMQVPSRFPIVNKTGELNERLEERIERFEDFDE